MNWLRERREQIGISQGDLAAALQLEGIDVSRAAVSSWETGRNHPPLKDETFRFALSRVLRLPVREILKRSGYEIVASSHTEEAEVAAALIDQMDTDMRRKAVKLIEALL